MNLTCCSVLQCALQCVAVCCSVLQCVAVCCSVVQCGAVCCSVLQRVAVCWGLGVLCLRHDMILTCCSALQCVAVCCSMLQQIAASCSVKTQNGVEDLVSCVWGKEKERTSVVCCSVLQCVADCYRVSSKIQKDRERDMLFLLFIISLIQFVDLVSCVCKREGKRKRMQKRVTKCHWVCVCDRGLLQCVAVCCSVLQCVAVCCSVLHCLALFYIRMKQKVSKCVGVYWWWCAGQSE